MLAVLSNIPSTHKEISVDISMNTSTALAQNASTDVQLAVLKKSIDMEAKGAITLINSLPQPPQQSSTSLPSVLGLNINVIA